MTRALPTALLLAFPLAFMVLAQPGSAQTAPTSAVKQNVKYTAVQKLVKVTTDGGKRTETLVASPLTVVRGDVLVEEVTVQNVGRQTLPQVTVTMPMPNGTSFTGQATAASGRITLAYSTDGGRNFTPTPQHISSVTQNGKTVLQKSAAPMGEVTNVRWNVRDVKAGETLKLTYRVSVN
ncbi:hypothetical protein HNQ07_003163 [Deinococcus metalli]|nr:hypothetical protein [Deinococcus metalli]MBB5377664.1 hypothetical protein [Deinococcus metalli]